MDQKRFSIKLADIIIATIALIVGVFTFFIAFGQSEGTPYALIEANGKRYYYRLDQTVDLDFEGPMGHTHVRIANGQAWFTDSDCRDKICVSYGRLTEVGNWAACLPNRVMLRILRLDAKNGAGGIDGVAW